MTVATYTRPNVAVQSAAVYKANIDAMARVFERLGGAFAAHEQNLGSPSPDLTVRVDAGFIFVGVTLTEVAAQTVSGFTIPSAGQNRVDRVVVDTTTGVASRIAGTAVTGSPTAVAPAITAGKLPCCQVLITSSNTVITNSMITDERTALGSSGITLGTEQPSTSGLSIDFTGIPSGVRRITVMLSGVSVDGTSNLMLQIGPAGAPETTGYLGSCARSNQAATAATTGFIIAQATAAASIYHGAVVLDLEDSAQFTWASHGILAGSDATELMFSAGVKSAAAEVTRVRITSVGGAVNFDAGAINISWER